MRCIPALAVRAVLVFSGLFQQRCSTLLPVECAAGLFLTGAEERSTEKGHTGTSLLRLQNIAKWSKDVVIVMKKGFSGPRVPAGRAVHYYNEAPASCGAWSVS